MPFIAASSSGALTMVSSNDELSVARRAGYDPIQTKPGYAQPFSKIHCETIGTHLMIDITVYDLTSISNTIGGRTMHKSEAGGS